MATMHVAKLPPHCMRVQPDDTGRPVSYHTTSGRELEMEFRDEADEEPKLSAWQGRKAAVPPR